MISHKTSTFAGLLQEMNKVAREYCYTHKLPPISVFPDDGSIEPKARAHFNWRRKKIFVSSRLLDYLSKYPDRIKVWGLFSAVKHELRHYEQYMYMISHRIQPSKDKFDEEDAQLSGRLFADDKVHKLTPEEINPILSTLGTYMLGGVGLYAGIQAAKWGHEKIKERVKITKNPLYTVKIEGGRMSVIDAKNMASAHSKAKNMARGLYGSGQTPEIISVKLSTAEDASWFKMMSGGESPVKANPAKPHTEVVVSQLPKCNFCTKDARFDGKTRMGPWAYMCFAHYAQYGVGLGLGKGQRLILSKKNPGAAFHEKRAKMYRGEPKESSLYNLYQRLADEQDAMVHFSKVAGMPNPIPKHCAPKKFGSETYYYAGKTMFRDKLDRAISDLKALGVKCKHSIRSKSYGYMLWTSKPTAVHFEMM